MHIKKSLNAVDAQRMIVACKDEANRNNWKVSIAIVDEAGYLLHLERQDGAGLQSPDIAFRKARTSALSRQPTKALEDAAKERPCLLNFPERLPVQGGIPLIVDGQCVGAIGVSGVKSPEDEQIAFAGQRVLVAG